MKLPALTSVVSAIVFAASAAFLVAPTGCPPKVYKLHGTKDPGKAFNVLILGDGFTTETELAAYRRAAEVLADKLFDDALFHRWRQGINVYRIDAESRAGVSLAQCRKTEDPPCAFAKLTAPPPQAARTLAADQNVRGPAVVRADLESQLCWTVNAPADQLSDDDLCKALWIGTAGQQRALELAFDALDIHVVVVLTNSWNVAGGGLEDALPSTGALGQRLGLAVLGVPSTEDGTLTDEATELLAHELGHTVGLLDEYERASGPRPGSLPQDRNVYIPAAADACWVPDLDTVAPPSAIPWHGLMNCYWSAACNCGPTLCRQPWVPQDLWPDKNPCCDAWFVRRIPQPCTQESLFPCPAPQPIGVPTACLAHPGLWEGANYSRAGMFRAKFGCRMRELDQPFCEACGLVVDRALAAFGPPAP